MIAHRFLSLLLIISIALLQSTEGEHFCHKRERTAYYTKYRLVPVTKFREVDVCCPGWIGHDCDIACPAGMFGENCESQCDCSNDATCHPSDGVCVCKPGYVGSKCERACQPGEYGHYCLQTCDDCPEEHCDHKIGCIHPTTLKPTTSNETTPPQLSNKFSKPETESKLGDNEEVDREPPKVEDLKTVNAVNQDTDNAKLKSIGKYGKSTKMQQKNSATHYILIPVIIGVLAIGIVVVVLVVRRRRKENQGGAAENDYSVHFNASPAAIDGAIIENLRNQNLSNGESYAVEASYQGAAFDSELSVKKLDEEDELKVTCISYRDRMNDLSKPTDEDEGREGNDAYQPEEDREATVEIRKSVSSESDEENS